LIAELARRVLGARKAREAALERATQENGRLREELDRLRRERGR